jgi:hypothetical protein
MAPIIQKWYVSCGKWGLPSPQRDVGKSLRKQIGDVQVGNKLIVSLEEHHFNDVDMTLIEGLAKDNIVMNILLWSH